MTRNNEKNLWMKRNVMRMSIVTRMTLTSASIATEEGGTRWRGANRDATAAATGATPLQHAFARHFNSNVERCKILIQREATSWGVWVQANIHSYISIWCDQAILKRFPRKPQKLAFRLNMYNYKPVTIWIWQVLQEAIAKHEFVITGSRKLTKFIQCNNLWKYSFSC